MSSKRFTKTIEAPLRRVYDWCTDFRLEGSDGGGSTTNRRILESTRTRSVFVDLFEGARGKPGVAVNVVSLSPPNAWHLDLYGDPRNETVDYNLTSLGKARTRLDMRFRVGLSEIERVWFSKLWDRWASELEEEYMSHTRGRRARAAKVR